MKLFDFAMKLDHPDILVMLIDSESGRVAFNGTADELLDFSGLDHRKVHRIGLLNTIPATLRIEIK